MRRLALDAVDASTLLRCARDRVAQLFRHHAGERTTDAVRLPAGGLLHLGDGGALRARQEDQQSSLDSAMLALRSIDRAERLFDAGMEALGSIYDVAAECPYGSVSRSQGEGGAILAAPPHNVVSGRGHLLEQPAPEQAASDVADSATFSAWR